MDKASAHGAGDCRFESCRGHDKLPATTEHSKLFLKQELRCPSAAAGPGMDGDIFRHAAEHESYACEASFDGMTNHQQASWPNG